MVASTVWIIYQIMFTSLLTEAQKYFIITTVFFIYMALYTRLIIETRIQELERKVAG